MDYWESMEKRKLAEQTKVTRTRTLKAQFNFYGRMKYIDLNPWNEFDLKKKFLKPRSLNNEELRLLISEIDTSTFVGFRLYVMVHFIIDNGTRIGNLLKIDESDVDFENNRVFIPETETKNGKEHYALMSKKTERLIKQLMEKNKKIKGRCPALFIDSNGNRLSYSAASESLRNYTRNSGVYFTFHKGRHTFATNYYEKSQDLESLMKIGGWLNAEAVVRYTQKGDEKVKHLHNLYSPINDIYE